ncbi:MAG: NUDIX domain-containing protein [Bauldia sp.]|nr:NUDIX domain-containing protein [Bauldia sp.]
MTLGVRAAVFDGDGRVLLVRHSYTPGWHFPGGGVEPGEATGEALARELDEEAGIALTGEPHLHGLYFSRHISRRDHVAVFVCREWRQARNPGVPNLEIVACRFFSPEALPDDITAGTRRRLGEIVGGAPRSADWNP